MKRGHFAGALVVAALLLAWAMPSAAGASINVYQSSEDAQHLGEVKSAKCKLRRRPNGDRTFTATGRTTNGAYDLSVLFLDFRGFGREYEIHYGGVPNPAVDFEGRTNGEDYSSAYPFPGTPPGAAGGIKFANDGKQISIGTYALPNADYSQGVAIVGAMRCRYPRR